MNDLTTWFESVLRAMSTARSRGASNLAYAGGFVVAAVAISGIALVSTDNRFGEIVQYSICRVVNWQDSSVCALSSESAEGQAVPTLYDEFYSGNATGVSFGESYAAGVTDDELEPGTDVKKFFLDPRYPKDNNGNLIQDVVISYCRTQDNCQIINKSHESKSANSPMEPTIVVFPCNVDNPEYAVCEDGKGEVRVTRSIATEVDNQCKRGFDNTGGNLSDVAKIKFYREECLGSIAQDMWNDNNDGNYGEGPQGNLPPEILENADLTLTSIGGNDLGFSSILTSCIFGSCPEEKIVPTLGDSSQREANRIIATCMRDGASASSCDMQKLDTLLEKIGEKFGSKDIKGCFSEAGSCNYDALKDVVGGDSKRRIPKMADGSTDPRSITIESQTFVEEMTDYFLTAQRKTPNAYVVNIGYPPFFDDPNREPIVNTMPDGSLMTEYPKGSVIGLLDKEDRIFMNNSVADTNAVIEIAAMIADRQAKEEGMPGVHFINPEKAMTGHGLDSTDPWMRGFSLFKAPLNTWYHPLEPFYDAMAQEVLEWSKNVPAPAYVIK